VAVGRGTQRAHWHSETLEGRRRQELLPPSCCSFAHVRPDSDSEVLAVTVSLTRRLAVPREAHFERLRIWVPAAALGTLSLAALALPYFRVQIMSRCALGNANCVLV
jgi:hypothetical protein